MSRPACRAPGRVSCSGSKSSLAQLIIVVLLVMSVYYARHQVAALRRVRESPELPDEEAHYQRRKAYRRLISCGLLLLLATLLTALLTVYELPTGELAEQRKDFTAETAPPFTPEQKAMLRYWGWMWIALLLVLSAVLVLAAVDLLSTRRYALRQFRKLQADRREMIERQAKRMRRDRNGHG